MDQDVEKTRKELAKIIETPGVRKRIAKEIGVAPKWVDFFANGHIKEPGVFKYQRLVKYLEEHAD